MIKSGFKALLLSGLIFLSSSFYFVNAEPRAIDYSQTINSDFTDGLTIQSTHMCGECRGAGDLTELDGVVPHYHKIIIDNMVTNKIPQELIDSFRYSGHRLLLTSKDIRGYECANLDFEPAGAYSSATKTLYLSNKYDNYWAEQSLVHEFGHYLDFATWSAGNLNSRASRTDEFTKIWREERDRLEVDNVSNLDYYRNTITEYFAQSFDEYISKPERLKENNPKTYNYIKKCLRIIELSVCGGK